LEKQITTRRFEFIAGNSAKFWEISTNQREVTVRYGRLGTAGQSLTKSFVSDVAASSHVSGQISSKLGKGYVEVTAA